MFFILIFLSMLLFCLLVLLFLIRSYLLILLGPNSTWWVVYLLANVFFDFVCQHFYHDDSGLRSFTTWSLLIFLDVLINIFMKFEKLSVIFFCFFMFSSCSGTPIMHVMVYWMIAPTSLRLFIFLPFKFFSYSSLCVLFSSLVILSYIR